MPRVSVLLVLSLIIALPMVAQDPVSTDTGPAASGGGTELAPEEDLFVKTLALDIATASYFELVEWVRSLGLSEAGDAQALRSRLYEHYGTKPPESAAGTGYVVTISSARKTEYFTIEGVDDSIIRLSGGVDVTVQDPEKAERHLISAEEIVFNKTQNLMTATGNVRYEKKGAGGSEFFYGESLSIDLDTWEGRFFDGITSIAGDSKDAGSKLSFSAEGIERANDGVLVLTEATITSCPDPNPHFSIRAGKVWILGNNEWAIADATLCIGEVPYFWLPFFYYPGEEIVFHPVFGSREREGRFVQTTTYILGEKPATDEKISFFKLTQGSAGLERELRGVFLRTTDKKAATKSSDLLKVMLDIYVNLGFFAGVDGKFQSSDSLVRRLEFKFGIARSQSVFYDSSSGTYMPYSYASDFESVWNDYSVLNLTLPFRFGLELTLDMSAGPWSASVAMPFYSDPYFNYDFRYRSEDMRWLRFLEQDEDDTAQPAELASFIIKLDNKLSFGVSALAPWVSSMTIDTIATNLNVQSKLLAYPTDPDAQILYGSDPFRKFFYPDRMKLFGTGMTVSGTLFSYPFVEKAPTIIATTTPATTAPATTTPATMTPATTAESPTDATTVDAAPVVAESAAAELARLRSLGLLDPFGGSDDDSSASAPSQPGGGFDPGLRAPDFVLGKEHLPLAMSLSYSVTPSASMEVLFASSDVLASEQVDFESLCSIMNMGVSGSLSFKADAFDRLFTSSLTLTYLGKKQFRPHVSGDATLLDPVQLESYANADATATNQKLGFNIGVGSSPLQDAYFWSPTTLSYTLNLALFVQDHLVKTGLPPEYRERTLAWDKEGVTGHSAAITFGILPWDQKQTLTVSMTLPPLDEGYTFTLSSKLGPFSLSGSTKLSPLAWGAAYSFDKLTLSPSLSFDGPVTIGDSFVYDFVEGHPTQNTISFSGWGLSSSFEMLWGFGSTLLPTGWTFTAVEDFRPNKFSFGYNLDLDPDPFWENRIAVSLDLGIGYRQDLQRFTNADLSLNCAFTLKIYKFLDISFKAVSVNSQPYRYWPWLLGADPDSFVNPFVDIANSLDFFDPTLVARRSALFKLRSISIELTHQLDDWNFIFKVSAYPELDRLTDPAKPVYVFKPSFTFMVAWVPIPEFKSTVTSSATGLTVK